MKKILPIILLFITANAKAQSLPNGDFENWTSAPYEEPSTWNTGNIRDLQRVGQATVTKVTGYSGFGVRIETIINSKDTSESYMINIANPCDDPPNWKGGVPYSQVPTAITGYYRYYIPAADTGLMLVIFRKNGVHVGDNVILIKGTGNQPNWTPFSFPVYLTDVPDSMIIAVASSNKLSNVGLENGTFIELDNLAFAGASQPIPNGTFESWTPSSVDVAAGWTSTGDNGGVSKTTNRYSGTYALRLETQSGCDNPNPSGVTTGYDTPNNGPAGGKPYTLMMDTLTGYYRYAPVGNDTGYVYVSLTKNGSQVGGAWQPLLSAPNYTYFELPFTAFSPPDTMRVDIYSSNWSSAHAGTVLYVDDLKLKSMTVGIREPGSLPFRAYPNPATDRLFIDFSSLQSDVLLQVYDAIGNLITEHNGVNETILSIDVHSLPSGFYFYQVKTENHIYTDKFIKE